MKEDTPIINILTYELPFKLSNQIYNEFNTKFKEAKFLIENRSYFNKLSENIKAVELILALSVFNKRVVSNLDAATKFYKTVNMSSGADSIKMGTYTLTKEEQNKLLSVVITFRNLHRKYSLTQDILQSDSIKEFLKKLIELKKRFDSEKNNVNNSSNEDTSYSIDELPF